jgi:hypothetical protein
MAHPYPAQADRWIRRTTTASVLLLAAIAAVVSYRHMHALALAVGESPWTAALIPLSVDGMILASSMTLLLDSRCGNRGGTLPWALLMTGSAASLAANVAVAQPTWCGRIIAAWPSFALIGAYELLMRQVRHTIAAAAAGVMGEHVAADSSRSTRPRRSSVGLRVDQAAAGDPGGRELQRRAWQWAVANLRSDGALPSGKAIAARFDRHERWGRLVKKAGLAGELS